MKSVHKHGKKTQMDALIISSAFLHVFLSPYTKVEESFNLHATHDALFYGIKNSALENVSIVPFTRVRGSARFQIKDKYRF